MTPTKQEAELLPCPFCGSVDVELEFDFDACGSNRVQCNQCDAQVSVDSKPVPSLEPWNRRATPSTPAPAEVQEQQKSAGGAGGPAPASDALEAAIAVCDAERVEETSDYGDTAYNLAIDHCIEGIRALQIRAALTSPASDAPGGAVWTGTYTYPSAQQAGGALDADGRRGPDAKTTEMFNKIGAHAKAQAQNAARYEFWKTWWAHSDERGQLPAAVDELLHDMDLDDAFDVAIAAAAKGEQ